MIVKPIEALYVEEGNRVTANKLRVSKIKENLTDSKYLGVKFSELDNSLNEGKLDSVMDVVVNSLFFEEVHTEFITKLYKAYSNAKDKAVFMLELIESYKIRGVKSIRFAWTPIINK